MVDVDINKLRILISVKPYGKPYSVSIFIREFLRMSHESYPYKMWKYWEIMNTTGRKHYKFCKYTTFLKYIYYLNQLELIRFVPPRKKVHDYGVPRKYYSLNFRNINDPAWFDLRKAMAILKGWNIA